MRTTGTGLQSYPSLQGHHTDAATPSLVSIFSCVRAEYSTKSNLQTVGLWFAIINQGLNLLNKNVPNQMNSFKLHVLPIAWKNLTLSRFITRRKWAIPLSSSPWVWNPSLCELWVRQHSHYIHKRYCYDLSILLRHFDLSVIVPNLQVELCHEHLCIGNQRENLLHSSISSIQLVFGENISCTEERRLAHNKLTVNHITGSTPDAVYLNTLWEPVLKLWTRSSINQRSEWILKCYFQLFF